MINRIHILLVEDDEVDTEAIMRALRRREINYSLTTVSNGIDALNTLRGENGQPLRPHIILLDINMPRMNGIEFLQILRDDSELKQTIVFVLTTSNADEDKRAAYDKQIAGYLLKSQVGTDFSQLVTLLNCYERSVEFPLTSRYG